MRTTVVAVLTFAAGLFLGALLFSGSREGGPRLLEDGLLEEGGEGAATSEGPGNLNASRGSAEGTRPPQGPTLEAAGRAAGKTQRQARRAWVLRLLDDGYAYFRQQKETAVPAELRAAAGTSAEAYVRRSIHNFGGWLRGYIDKQRALGSLGDPPRLVLQARGSGNVSVSDWPVTLRQRARISTEPLDLGSIPEGPRDLDVYLETGVPPLDRALVIERIDLESRLADAKATLSVRVDGAKVFQRQGGEEGEREASLEGLVVFTAPYDDVKISASLFRSSVGLVARGRYVTLEEARSLKERQFRWVQEGDDGLLGEDPVTLQILADHGGGSACILRLDGTTNGRVKEMSETDVWDDALDLTKVTRPLAWTENAGTVPPGKIYRITRIDWRARLDPKKSSHSRFMVRIGGKELVKREAPDGLNPSETWEGQIDVHPGEERRLELVCAYFAMGEAVLVGTLIDAGEASGK